MCVRSLNRTSLLALEETCNSMSLLTPVTSITYGSGHFLEGRLACLPFESGLASAGGQANRSATRAAMTAWWAKLMVNLL